MKAFLWRGAVAGAAAGVVAAVYQWAVTERDIRAALAIEAAANPASDEMFSRTTQTIGGMLAACIYGVLLGVVFGFVLAVAAPLLAGATWFARATRLSSMLFAGWVLIPQLKYPANPPGVGDPDTIGQRTTGYVALMIIGLGVVFGSVALWRWLMARGVDEVTRFAIVVAVAGSVVGLAYALLPGVSAPTAVPVSLIWRFRIHSLVENAMIWFGIATAFGFLARPRRSAHAAVPSHVATPVS